MTRADDLARLAACAAEARAILLACGLDDVSDASVADAIADADAEHKHSTHTANRLVGSALRHRLDVIIAAHEYLARITRAQRALAEETT